MQSMSASAKPAFWKTSRVAGAGPIPISAGSTPTVAHAVGRRASGFRALSRTAVSDARINAAPPSTMPDALPAVTQPFLLNAVGNFASTSIVVSGRMWSSRAKSSVPFRVFSSTGTTSSSKRPSAQARAASCWLRIAYSSCASRLTPVLHGAVLRGRGHRAAAVRVEERRPQRVFQLSLTETQAAPQPANHVRRLAHALHAAREHHVRFTKKDLMRRLNGGLDAGIRTAG